jgi:hypothetical protein
MEPIDSGIASVHLEILRRIVSKEYGAALDYAIRLIEQQRMFVERARVVSMLTKRAQGTDYMVLQGVLLEMAKAASDL